MWILTVFGFVLIVGTLLGVAWRFLEDMFEKRAALRVAQAELAMEAELNPPTNSDQTVVSSDETLATAKSN
jgi:hypothetical protein